MKRRVGNQLARWLALGITALVVAAIGSTAFAIPPVKQPVAFDVAGLLVYDCGEFNILTDYSGQGHSLFFFDKEGNLARQDDHINYSKVEFYNSQDSSKRVYGTGVVEFYKWTYIGDPPTLAVARQSFNVNVPGYGVILIRVGRLVLDLTTFEFVFEAGPVTVEEFLTDSKDAFCAFLS